VNIFIRPRNLKWPRVRVVVFYHAGGSTAGYLPLVREFPDEWDVLLYDLPGHGRRHAETPLAEMTAIVERAASELQAELTVPYVLLGHSMGAIVAVETARLLDAVDLCPLWVGVSGRGAPSAQTAAARRLHELDETSLLGVLRELGGGIPDRIVGVQEFRERFLLLARADLYAVESYVPSADRRQLSCPLTAFAGVTDPWASTEAVAAWRQETRSAFVHRRLPGGHFYFTEHGFGQMAREAVSDICAAALHHAIHQ
jgi:surfactin synthase thioesterase subunit